MARKSRAQKQRSTGEVEEGRYLGGTRGAVPGSLCKAGTALLAQCSKPGVQ